MIDDRVIFEMAEIRRWAGRRSDIALIMGGGPCIENDFNSVIERLGIDALLPVLISVKQHGMIYLRNAHGLDADLCVFMEDPDVAGQEALRTALLMAPEVYRVSPFTAWSNVRIDEPWWNGGFSASLAVWFACAAGFEHVLLAGFDLYQGQKKYWYDRPGYWHPSLDAPLKNHVEAWLPALQRVPGIERVRAVSGPLIDVFGRWLI